MDQVKKILGILMAQRFWILCGAVTLVPVGGWFTTTSSMRATTDARKSAIKQKMDAAQALLGKQNHPNDESHKFMDELRIRVTNEVGDAWRIQYERQEELLVWPAELGPDFISVVDPLRPLEKIKPPVTANDEILSSKMRERYRDYIFAELPKLAKKIDALWVVQEATESGGDMGGGGGFASGGAGGVAGPSPGFAPGAAGGVASATGKPTIIEKVVWDQQDQTALRAKYDWSNTKDKAPRTIDVLYAQQDLWIMSALMGIIANTNQGSTARYNAVIKEINYINIGRDVGGSAGSVMRINAGIGADGMGGMGSMGMGGMEGGAVMGLDSGGIGGGAATGMASGVAGGMTSGGESGGMMDPSGGGMGAGAMMDPAQFRYVDLNYQPVPAETLRTAITSETQDPANAFLVVAKRIPIRLGLTVDQRKLNRLISECGNASLMVEVRQVRFNRQGGRAAGGSGGMGSGGMGSGGMGMGGMGMGGMGGMGMSSMGGESGGEDNPGMSSPGYGGMESGMGGGYGGLDANSLPSDVSPHDKPVEIYGVVYLYNPVDLKRLGIEKKEADSADESPATDGTIPPANPVPAAAAGG